jgi:hypothetical protein
VTMFLALGATRCVRVEAVRSTNIVMASWLKPDMS